jgi:hypothetical protein
MDKINHIIAGVAAAIIVALPAYIESNNLFARLWVALWSGLLAGGIKEWSDYQHDCRWDWYDFGCTMIGAVIVAIGLICLHFGH